MGYGEGAFGGLSLGKDGARIPEEEKLLLEKTLSYDSNACGECLSLQLQQIARLVPLQRLTIRSNSLTVLPDSTGLLDSLKELTITSGLLTLLPESLSGLTNLSSFRISHTPLKVLPGWISKWISLTLLDLGWTDIHQLPPEIGELKQLAHLNLTGLTLESIPFSLTGLGLPFYFEEFNPTRRGVCLHDTVLTMQPIRLFQLSQEELERYYASPLQEVDETKVILLGDGSVGKTYTVTRILNGCRAETPEHPYQTEMTHGILIKPHEIKRDGTSFRVQFWDFGGQEIMYSAHQCFLTRRCCYVIMISTRVPGQATWRAQHWLHTVDFFAGSVPVILAVNCWGKKSSRTGLDETALREQFPSLSEVVYFSAVDPSDQDVRRLEEAILDHSRKRLFLPAPWEDMRRELLSRTSYYITQREYDAICDKHGLCQDREIRDWLLKWFHDLGVCLSYRLSSPGRDAESFKVLKPKWLTSAVYKIVLGVGFEKNGFVSHSEIQRILSDPAPFFSGEDSPFLGGLTYSKKESTYVLEVMRKFQVSYPASDTEEFIPALLPANAPAMLIPQDFKTCILLKVRYCLLPESVVHRLMIRCFQHLKPSKCWRRGLYLNYSEVMGSEALVTMESGGRLDDCELRISVYTEQSKCSSILLNFLIKQIRLINKKMHLPAEEFIYVEQGDYGEWFSIKRLWSLKRRGAAFVQGTDTEFDLDAIWETFGGVLSQEEP